MPVSLGLGIISFFTLPFDPEPLLTIGLVLMMLGFLYLALRQNGSIACWLLTFLLLGFIVADCKTHFISHNILKQKLEKAWVEGTVDEFSLTPKGLKIILKNVNSHNPLIDVLDKVRLSSKTKDISFAISDRILVRTTLMPPPLPTYPGCARKSCTHLAGESPAVEGEASSTA
jgi:multisubunit Na+/H+ antiporter MnhG subunit